MYTAMSSTAVATGARVWLNAQSFGWLTPKRMARITVALIVAALIASATLVSGSG
jgi:hypothetical protein